MAGLVAAVTGGLVGLGVVLFVAGCRGLALFDLDALRSGRFGQYVDRLLLRAGLAIVCATFAFAFSDWMVLGLVSAAVGWWLPSWPASRGAYERDLALVEAIATWTEQIRDTLAAANGLEHALGATAALAPPPLAGPAERLAARTGYEPLPDSLRSFADEVDHPLADYVVAALVIAAEHQARDLGALLGTLADSARDQARMRTRVWVGRARNRSAVRIISIVIAGFVVGLLLLNRSYLQPYDSAGGQTVLSLIIVLFGASLVTMNRIGRIAMPERFVRRRAAAALQPAELAQ